MSLNKIADMVKAITVFTKTLLWKITEGHPVEQEEIDALNEMRTEAGMKPLNIAIPSEKKSPEPEKRSPQPEGKAPPASDAPEFNPHAIVINGHSFEGQMLPDNAMWTNRFDIRSESSNRLYRIAQNKRKRYWACSCPGWIGHRKCKHLKAMELPWFEEPFEAQLKAASAKTGAVKFADDSYSPVAYKLAAELIHSDAELSKMMEQVPEIQGEAHIDGPEAGPSNDELHDNAHAESGVPVTDGNIKSPERQNVNAIREALETQVEMEVGKPVEQKQQEVAMQEKVQDAALAQGAGSLAGGAQEVSAKPGTQIIINVGSKEAATQKPKLGNVTPELINQAKELIELDDQIIYDIAADADQIVGNVANTSWFARSVAEHLAGDPTYYQEALARHQQEAAGMASRQQDSVSAHSGSKSAAEFADWCDNCIFRLHPQIMMSYSKSLEDEHIGKCERCGNKTSLRSVKVPGQQQEPDFDQLLHEEQLDKTSAEPIGGENQDKVTSGQGGGMFGGTDLEGPSFKTPFHVGFTFRGTQREASFSSFKEAHAFIKSASARFGRIAGNWTMKCPQCKGQATKDRREDSYKCSCGWNSHTATSEKPTTPKKASVKTAVADPAKRNLVLEILSHGPKTTGQIEKALGGGKYTNISWPILQELAKEGLLKHKQMRWSLKASVKIAEWKGWTEDMPVQVVGDRDHEVFPNLAAAKQKYPTLDPEHSTNDFTWAMRGEIKGVPAIRFETWPANRMYSASVKKATLGKTAFTVETRITEGSNAARVVTLKIIMDKLNVIFSEVQRKNPKGYLDSFEQQLPNFMLNLAQEMGVQMDYVPESDTYMFYDAAGATTKGKKFEEFEQVGKTSFFSPEDAKKFRDENQGSNIALEQDKPDAEKWEPVDPQKRGSELLKSATIRITSVKSMPQKGTPEWAELKIAIQTLKMPDPMVNVMGGPGREYALKTLERYGLRWDEEAYMAGGKGVKKADWKQAALPQGTTLVAKQDLQIGKKIVKAGTGFWVANTRVDQDKTGTIEVASLKQKIGQGSRISAEQVEQFFTIKASKQAGDGMAKTEEQVEKEAGFNFFFPGQVLKEFYPEIQHEIVDYPNATNQPMSGAGNPEIVGDNSGEIEGMLDDALDTTVVEMIQLPADVGGVEPLAMAAADYSSTKPAGGMGIGRDGKPEVLEGAPLRKENDIRGYMFTDEFYGQYEGIPGAAMAVASKTAAEGDESKQFSLFLKKVCGEIAATFVASFKVTQRPLLDKVPGVGEIQLDVIEQGSGTSMPLGQTTQGGRVRWLMDKLNDSDVKDAINQAWAQAAVWNDNTDGGFVYEVFVRPETIDTESLIMKYKFVCGTRE